MTKERSSWKFVVEGGLKVVITETSLKDNVNIYIAVGNKSEGDGRIDRCSKGLSTVGEALTSIYDIII
jgi:hypothetical protein